MSTNKKKDHKLQKVILASVLSTSVFATAHSNAFATGSAKETLPTNPNYESILKKPIALVPTEETILPSKYQFIPQYIKGKTEVVPFGPKGTWSLNSLTEENVEDGSYYTAKNPTNDMKGKIGMTYKNVGEVNGLSVDIKITVDDWDEFFTGDTFITYKKASIGHSQAGFNSVKQTWEYVYSDNRKGPKIEGSYLSLTDIDVFQGVTFDEENVKKIERVYVTEDTWIQSNTNNDHLELVAPFADDASFTDDFAMATVLFNSNKITFEWNKLYEMAGYDKDFPHNYLNGKETFIFNARKLARSETPTPNKTVSDSDESKETINHLDKLNETYSYRFSHSVPYEIKKYYYNSYELNDAVIDEIEIDPSAVRIMDSNNEDVTDQFENQSTGNTLKYVAKSETLQKQSFYNKTYSITFDAKVKDGANLGKYEKDGEISLPNTAKVFTDGKEQNSTTTQTIVPKVETSINKSILEPTGEQVKDSIKAVNQDFDYRIDYSISNTKDIEKLAIGDDLENALDLKAAKVFDAETDEEISDQGTFSIDEEEEKVLWLPNDPQKFSGKSFYLKITASIKEDADLDGYEVDSSYVIPNEATLSINDTETTSNIVNVETPQNLDMIAPTKSVKDSDQEGTENALENRDEAYQYSIKHDVGKKNFIFKNYLISDEIQKELEASNFKVTNKNGDDVTEQFDIDVDENNKLTASAQSALLKSDDFYDNTYTITFDAKVKEDADLVDLETAAEHSYEVPNVATVTVDKDTLYTNATKTTFEDVPKTPEEPIEKPEEPNESVKPPKDPIEKPDEEKEIPQTGSNGTGYAFFDFLKNLFK